MASHGQGGTACKLTDAQLDRLAAELHRGPAAQDWADWADQRWTLARVAALIRHLFGVPYNPARGVVSAAPDRLDPQVPTRRAIEHTDAIAAWCAATWAKVRG